MSLYHVANTPEGFEVRDRQRKIIDGPFKRRSQATTSIQALERGHAPAENLVQHGDVIKKTGDGAIVRVSPVQIAPLTRTGSGASVPLRSIYKTGSLTWWAEPDGLFRSERSIAGALHTFSIAKNSTGQYFASIFHGGQTDTTPTPFHNIDTAIDYLEKSADALVTTGGIAPMPSAKPEKPVSIFFDFFKADADQRIVEGIASSERLDSQDEIVDSEAIKAALPNFMEWGNLREMHENKAAGTVIKAEVMEGEFEVNGKKLINPLHIVARVVDDDAWKKVKEGVYKGFSIGGKVLKAIEEMLNGKTIRRITDLALHEISLVDRPANEDARILVWKGIGLQKDTTQPVQTASGSTVTPQARAQDIYNEQLNTAARSRDARAVVSSTTAFNRAMRDANELSPEEQGAIAEWISYSPYMQVTSEVIATAKAKLPQKFNLCLGKVKSSGQDYSDDDANQICALALGQFKAQDVHQAAAESPLRKGVHMAGYSADGNYAIVDLGDTQPVRYPTGMLPPLDRSGKPFTQLDRYQVWAVQGKVLMDVIDSSDDLAGLIDQYHIASKSAHSTIHKAANGLTVDELKRITAIMNDNPIVDEATIQKERLAKGKKFESCVTHVMDSGKSKESAYAICTVALGETAQGKPYEGGKAARAVGPKSMRKVAAVVIVRDGQGNLQITDSAGRNYAVKNGLDADEILDELEPIELDSVMAGYKVYSRSLSEKFKSLVQGDTDDAPTRQARSISNYDANPANRISRAARSQIRKAIDIRTVAQQLDRAGFNTVVDGKLIEVRHPGGESSQFDVAQALKNIGYDPNDFKMGRSFRERSNEGILISIKAAATKIHKDDAGAGGAASASASAGSNVTYTSTSPLLTGIRGGIERVGREPKLKDVKQAAKYPRSLTQLNDDAIQQIMLDMKIKPAGDYNRQAALTAIAAALGTDQTKWAALGQYFKSAAAQSIYLQTLGLAATAILSKEFGVDYPTSPEHAQGSGWLGDDGDDGDDGEEHPEPDADDMIMDPDTMAMHSVIFAIASLLAEGGDEFASALVGLYAEAFGDLDEDDTGLLPEEDEEAGGEEDGDLSDEDLDEDDGEEDGMPEPDEEEQNAIEAAANARLRKRHRRVNRTRMSKAMRKAGPSAQRRGITLNAGDMVNYFIHNGWPMDAAGQKGIEQFAAAYNNGDVAAARRALESLPESLQEYVINEIPESEWSAYGWHSMDPRKAAGGASRRWRQTGLRKSYTTLPAFNRLIAPDTLNAGNGYFWFEFADDLQRTPGVEKVGVNSFRQQTAEQWMTAYQKAKAATQMEANAREISEDRYGLFRGRSKAARSQGLNGTKHLHIRKVAEPDNGDSSRFSDVDEAEAFFQTYGLEGRSEIKDIMRRVRAAQKRTDPWELEVEWRDEGLHEYNEDVHNWIMKATLRTLDGIDTMNIPVQFITVDADTPDSAPADEESGQTQTAPEPDAKTSRSKFHKGRQRRILKAPLQPYPGTESGLPSNSFGGGGDFNADIQTAEAAGWTYYSKSKGGIFTKDVRLTDIYHWTGTITYGGGDDRDFPRYRVSVQGESRQARDENLGSFFSIESALEAFNDWETAADEYSREPGADWKERMGLALKPKFRKAYGRPASFKNIQAAAGRRGEKYMHKVAATPKPSDLDLAQSKGYEFDASMGFGDGYGEEAAGAFHRTLTIGRDVMSFQATISFFPDKYWDPAEDDEQDRNDKFRVVIEPDANQRRRDIVVGTYGNLAEAIDDADEKLDAIEEDAAEQGYGGDQDTGEEEEKTIRAGMRKSRSGAPADPIIFETALAKAVAPLQQKLESVTQELEQLKSQPTPGGPTLRGAGHGMSVAKTLPADRNGSRQMLLAQGESLEKMSGDAETSELARLRREYATEPVPKVAAGIMERIIKTEMRISQRQQAQRNLR